MKEIKWLLAAVVASVLVGCAAAQPKNTSDEDRVALKPLREKHVECMARNTANYVEGSSDVAFLVRHIASLCDATLEPIQQYLLSHGFSPTYAKGYVAGVREQNYKMTTSYILRIKGGQPLN